MLFGLRYKMISVKIHKAYRDVIAICDSDLIGKRFTEGERLLDVKESFYSGELMEKEKVINLMQGEAFNDATFNLVGKETIACAVEIGIINDEGVMRINNVPFALSLL